MLLLLFQSKFILNPEDPWIDRSLQMHLKNRTRQRRYLLKRSFFDTAADKSTVLRTPPEEVKHMSEADWCKLVDTWSTPEKHVVSLFTKPCHYFNSITYTVANLFILFRSVDGLYESYQ